MEYKRKSKKLPHARRRRKYNRYNTESIGQSDDEYDKAPWSNLNRNADKRKKRKRWHKPKKYIKTVGWTPTSGGGEFTNWIEDVNYRYPRRYSDVQPVFRIPMNAIEDDYAKYSSNDH